MDKRFKTIFRGITGSKLYGTSTPQSDTDIRGVFIPSEEFYLGFLNKVEQVESKEPDEVMWEISKFIKLCLDANPNIIELLFIPEECILESSDAWRDILKNKMMFLSTKIKYTFSGYAMSQLHRIKQHREWLLNPPSHKPTREEFGLPETNVITKDQINAYDELKNRENVPVLTSNFLEILQHEKAYFNASRYFQQYEEWKTERNKDRASLEAKFGYDTKHAMHLVRLISEGNELLTTGNITFPRPDAEELLDIRNGKYSYDALMNILHFENIDELFDINKDNWILQHTPDRPAGDLLCQKLIKSRLGYE